MLSTLNALLILHLAEDKYKRLIAFNLCEVLYLTIF